jgi:imidazoleglycerol phosphate dehydratase HisB
VRDGIVNMKEVELFILDHIYQFAGEGSIVWRIVKKGVFLCIDFVKEDIFLVMGEAHRALIGDKVNLMAFGGKGEA